MIITYPPTGGDAAALLSAVGQVKVGLWTRTSSVNEVAVSADLLLAVNASGEQKLLTAVSASADLTASGAGGLDTGSEAVDTHYYVYVIHNPSTENNAVLLSTQSTRLGQTPTLPTGYTFFREVGEVYNDSAGDLVGMSRVGDHVDFDDDSVEPLLNDGTIGPTFDELLYPSKAPVRAEQVKFNFRQASGTPSRMNIVLAGDSSGKGRVFEGNYTTSTGNTYDGSDNSLTAVVAPNRPDLANARIYLAAHWTFVSSATYDLYLAGYTWRV